MRELSLARVVTLHSGFTGAQIRRWGPIPQWLEDIGQRTEPDANTGRNGKARSHGGTWRHGAGHDDEAMTPERPKTQKAKGGHP